MSFSESGQFAALISAVDPVATLSLFNALAVDPSLNNIVVGESVLNGAGHALEPRAASAREIGVARSRSVRASLHSFPPCPPLPHGPRDAVPRFLTLAALPRSV